MIFTRKGLRQMNPKKSHKTYSVIAMAAVMSCLTIMKRLPLLLVRDSTVLMICSAISSTVVIIARFTTVDRDMILEYYMWREPEEAIRRVRRSVGFKEIYIMGELILELIEYVFILPQGLMLYMVNFTSDGQKRELGEVLFSVAFQHGVSS